MRVLIGLISLLSLFCSPAAAQALHKVIPLVPPCATATASATTTPSNTPLSVCGKRLFLHNAGTGNLFATTNSLHDYIVLPGAGRMMDLGPNDTIVSLRTDAGTSSVMVEQCTQSSCKWALPTP